MNRATPITIGGRVFYLEDDGYDQLRAYLDSLRAYFSDHQGRQEIIADIEARIAERFASLVTTGREEAIPLSEVVALMDAIGRPEDLSEGLEAPAARGKARRRLFRDTEEGMLAGVSAGLARYFDSDPNLIRAGFVVLGLAFGLGILLYVVLWIVIPAAHSSADRLTMRGEPVTLGGLASLPPNGERGSRTRKGFERIVAMPFHLIRAVAAAVADTFRRVFRAGGPLIRRAAGTAMVGGAAVFLAVVSLFSLLALTSFPDNYFDPIFAAFLNDAPRRLLALLSSIALLIPGVFVLAGGIVLLRGRNVLQPTTSLALLGVWFVALVFSGVIGLHTMMRWQAFESTYPPYQTESIILEPETLASLDVSRVRSYASIVDGPRTQVTIEGRRKEIERIDYVMDGGDLRITARPDTVACVICDEESVRITIASPTPDSIQTTGFVRRLYAAERERVIAMAQARADSMMAARALRESRVREIRDSLEAEQVARVQRIRERQDSVAAGDLVVVERAREPQDPVAGSQE